MTIDDAFDARLRTAFEHAQPGEDDADAFAQRILSRLGNAGRKRALAIGGAGSTGSIIASTQLEDVFSSLSIQDGVSQLGFLRDVAPLLSPELFAAGALALMIGGVAWMLPGRG